MTSKVDICNMAQGHIGSATRITSIDPPDGSVEADRCAMFFDIARRMLIEATAPSWAKTRVTLGATTNPSASWLFAYTKPSDCIKPLRIPTGLPSANGLLRVEDVSADFVVEGDLILTDREDATLIYLRDVDNPPAVTPMWTLAHSYMLASLLAGGAIKGRPGAQAAGQFYQLALSHARAAAASDANASSQRHEVQASWIGARA